MDTTMQQSGGSSPFGEWGGFLQGILLGAAEGVARSDGQQSGSTAAGSRGGNVGAAGALQFQDGSARDYATDARGGIDMKTILIGGGLLLVGLVVVKKLL